MEKNKECLLYRINILQERDPVRNAAIIKKIERQLRKMEGK